MTTLETPQSTIGFASPSDAPSTAVQLPGLTNVTSVPNQEASVRDPNPIVRQENDEAQPSCADDGSHSDRPAKVVSFSKVHTLADPTLSLAADILDDIEKVRIANANRLNALTRSTEDKDGEIRGFGLPEDYPDVIRLRAMLDVLEKVEKDAIKNLQKAMQCHALGPWVKQQRGLGDKQVARLLAAIGDPYWNTLHDRPRTVSELWSYCGYHVLPAGDHGGNDAQTRGVPGRAARRQKGQRSNWSDDARMRARMIAESCMKSGGPYREVYDAAKEKYADAVHGADCTRCTGVGQPPAPVGSPLKPAHIHARALRAISKAVLRDLWREAKRIHEAE